MVVLCNIFVETVIKKIQDSLMNRKFKRTFIWNVFCNIINLFTVSFDSHLIHLLHCNHNHSWPVCFHKKKHPSYLFWLAEDWLLVGQKFWHSNLICVICQTSNYRTKSLIGTAKKLLNSMGESCYLVNPVQSLCSRKSLSFWKLWVMSTKNHKLYFSPVLMKLQHWE